MKSLRSEKKSYKNENALFAAAVIISKILACDTLGFKLTNMQFG